MGITTRSVRNASALGLHIRSPRSADKILIAVQSIFSHVDRDHSACVLSTFDVQLRVNQPGTFDHALQAIRISSTGLNRVEAPAVITDPQFNATFGSGYRNF